MSSTPANICGGLATIEDIDMYEPPRKPRAAKKVASHRVLYPRHEARELLGGIGQTLLDKLCNEGKLDRIKLGRRSMITGESIQRIISEQR